MILGTSIKGITAIAMGGLSSGSFPVPSKRIVTRQWEHIWPVYSLWAMGLLPISVGFISCRGMPRLLAQNFRLSFELATLGALWGLGALLFGVSLVRLGIAISSAIVIGIVVLLGTLGPIAAGAVHLDLKQLIWLIGGLSLLVLSLLLCALASISRDRAQGIVTANSVFQARSVGPILVAVASGVLSSLLNIGFVFGAPLTEKARALGSPALLASVVIWVPVLFGGLVPNMGYPAYLITKKGSWSSLFSGDGTGDYWCRSSLMGVLWFGAVLLYGSGASMMGKSGAVYGWALFSATTILTSNVWGVLTGEWKGAGRIPRVLMWLSAALLVTSFVIIAAQQASG
jgi:L-rhamnose-H+ transport protein